MESTLDRTIEMVRYFIPLNSFSNNGNKICNSIRRKELNLQISLIHPATKLYFSTEDVPLQRFLHITFSLVVKISEIFVSVVS